MSPSEALDIIDRAVSAETDPKVLALCELITGSKDEPTRSVLGSLGNRIELVIMADTLRADVAEVKRRMGAALVDAGFKEDGVAYVRDAFERTIYPRDLTTSACTLVENIDSDIAEAWLEQTRRRRVRKAVGFGDGQSPLPYCTVPPPATREHYEYRLDVRGRQVSGDSERGWDSHLHKALRRTGTHTPLRKAAAVERVCRVCQRFEYDCRLFASHELPQVIDRAPGRTETIASPDLETARAT